MAPVRVNQVQSLALLRTLLPSYRRENGSGSATDAHAIAGARGLTGRPGGHFLHRPGQNSNQRLNLLGNAI